MAVLCFPIPLLRDAAVSFLSPQTDRRPQGFLRLPDVFLCRSLSFHVSMFLAALARVPLFIPPFSPWLFSLALCCLLSHFIFLSLLFPPFHLRLLGAAAAPRSPDTEILSPRRCPAFASSRPYNIKVRGYGPAAFHESSFAAQSGSGRKNIFKKKKKKAKSRKGESDVTHSPASEMNAL